MLVTFYIPYFSGLKTSFKLFFIQSSLIDIVFISLDNHNPFPMSVLITDAFVKRSKLFKTKSIKYSTPQK